MSCPKNSQRIKIVHRVVSHLWHGKRRLCEQAYIHVREYIMFQIIIECMFLLMRHHSLRVHIDDLQIENYNQSHTCCFLLNRV